MAETPEYQLYCFAQSGNAYRVALMLNLIGADWKPIFVDFFAAGETRTPKYRAEINEMGEVPVLVIAGIKLGSDQLPAGNQAGLWGSLLPAVWSYMLAARARGLGTAWTSLHLAYEREVAELLGIPADVHQGALIPTAYYTGETFRPAARVPLDEVIHLDRW